MNEPRPQTVSEIIQGCIVLAIMVGGIGWLAVAAWESGNKWWIGGMAIFLGSILLWGSVMAWLMACHFWHKWQYKRKTGRDDYW